MGSSGNADGWHKVAAGRRVVDFSDYARPAALLIVRALKDTPVRAWHLTCLYLVVGLASAAFFLRTDAKGLWTAAILLQVKNILDAADGSLARAQNRPSRIGRFLDSLFDFIVNAAVYLAVGWSARFAWGRWTVLAAALASLLSAHLQCSYYNYIFVRYRAATGGDTTSAADETAVEEPAHERGPLLDFLKRAYAGVYGWQDRIVRRADDWALGPAGRTAPVREKMDRDPAMVAAASLLRLGLQILLIDLAAAWGYPSSYFVLVLVPLNGWALVLLFLRRDEARRVASGEMTKG